VLVVIEDIMQTQDIQRALPAEIFDVITRVRNEYEEMPGMCLTLPQARRLLGLDQHTCAEIMNLLTDGGFLRRTRDGRYVRRES
jgi:hypothetical protein